MRRLLAALRLVRLVWTEDGDGEVRLRIARRFGYQWRCSAIALDNSVILNPDGSTSGKCYVKKWRAYDSRSPQPDAAKDIEEIDWPEYISEGWKQS